MWILFAFLAPALYAVAEIFDEYLANRGFKNIAPLIFYSCLLNAVFVPLLLIIQKPALPSANFILPLIGVGLTNLLYLYPYYKSLKIEDTSIVSGFFSIGKIIIPIFAFIFVGEVLKIREYVGIAIIILGNVTLAVHHSKNKFRLSKAFYLITIASVILAFDGILYKYMFENGVNFSIAIYSGLIVSSVLGCTTILLFRKTRNQLWEEKGKFRANIKLFFFEELFCFLAFVSETYAISVAPVSLVKGIGMAIPIFILTYTLTVKKFKPKAFHENTHRSAVIKKIFIFSLIILGLFLIGVNE